MNPGSDAVAHHAALDRRMVAVARGIRLLGSVSWPSQVQHRFLDHWRAGRHVLPVHDYPQRDFAEDRRELEAIAAAADPQHPLGKYLIDCCHNWSLTAQLIEVLGTTQVMDVSVQLFGRPDQPLPGNGPTTREAARHFINIANELDRALLSPAEQVAVSATSMQLQLQSALDDFFDARVIEVVVDSDLIAKAAAGATRIRLRGGATYSDYDRHQLLQHEAFVHSLTALNGREQPVLTSLSLASPRTTATQEGLAVFAEQITGSIDIERMKRISLRIEAAAMAMEGADFIQVFSYFLEAGQNAEESFSSAQRIFRGVPVTGGAAFTKDTVYLRGLIGIHTFFRWALREQKLGLCRQLFAGKMTLTDLQHFEPLFETGVLAPPRWMPQWVQRANGLAGALAFSLFANRIRLDQVQAEAPNFDV